MNQPSIEQKIAVIASRLTAKQGQISDILPDGISFQTFKTQILVMLRTSPEVLECTPDSIVAAAIDSALDALRCDGKEAIIVKRNMNVGTKSDRIYQNVAHYMPMAHGIRKKIIQSGAAVHVEAHVVYVKDFFRIFLGSDGRVEHEPYVDGDRGDMRGVYAIAHLPSGLKVPEYMSWSEVLEIKAVAGTDDVWKKWPGEMARKSVLRRIAKSLLGESQFVDIEMRRTVQVIEGVSTSIASPEQQQPIPPRPTRAALEDHSNTMEWNDFGGEQEREREPAQREQQDAPKKTAAKKKPAPEQADAKKSEPEEERVDIPANDAEWDLWAGHVTKLVRAAQGNADQLKQVRLQNGTIIANAPDDIRNEISTLIDESIADALSNGEPK